MKPFHHEGHNEVQKGPAWHYQILAWQGSHDVPFLSGTKFDNYLNNICVSILQIYNYIIDEFVETSNSDVYFGYFETSLSPSIQ